MIAVELLGIRSLSFAVGAYLSIATTLAIFCGGVVRWMVDRAVRKAAASPEEITESEISPGSLYASGSDRCRRHRRTARGLHSSCTEGVSEQRGGHW